MIVTFKFEKQEKTRYEVAEDIYVLSNDNTEYNEKFDYELNIMSNVTNEEFVVRFNMMNNIENRKEFSQLFTRNIAESLYEAYGVSLHDLENICEENGCVDEECWEAVYVVGYTMTGSKL